MSILVHTHRFGFSFSCPLISCSFSSQVGNPFVDAKVRPVGHACNFAFLLVELKVGQGHAMLSQLGVPGHSSAVLQTDCNSLLPLLTNLCLHVWEEEAPSLELATSCLHLCQRVAFVPNCDSLTVVTAIHMVFVPRVHCRDRCGCPRRVQTRVQVPLTSILLSDCTLQNVDPSSKSMVAKVSAGSAFETLEKLVE